VGQRSHQFELSTLLVAVACGGRSPLPSDEPEAPVVANAGSAGTAGAAAVAAAGRAAMQSSSGGAPTSVECDFDAELTTLPGPCQSRGLECSDDGGTDCGRCQGALQCFENRCYTEAGPPVSGFDAPLKRALYGSEEGQSFEIQTDGTVERLEAALWTDGPDLEVNIYGYCNGERTLIQSIPLPAANIPGYTLAHAGPKGPVVVELEPPLQVHQGDTLDVMFRTPLASDAQNCGTSGIYDSDVDPHSHFVSVEYYGITPDIGSTWDYMVDLFIH
jgi:hypothetical protein